MTAFLLKEGVYIYIVILLAKAFIRTMVKSMPNSMETMRLLHFQQRMAVGVPIATKPHFHIVIQRANQTRSILRTTLLQEYTPKNLHIDKVKCLCETKETLAIIKL